MQTTEDVRVIVALEMKDHTVLRVSGAAVLAVDDMVVGGQAPVSTITDLATTLLTDAVLFDEALALGRCQKLLRL